jgi:hypothetical protein
VAKAKALSSNPASALADAARFSELRSRLLFLIGALLLWRVDVDAGRSATRLLEG